MSYYVSLRKRPIVLAIVLGFYNIGSAVGPLVGGAITDNQRLTWRFIFWVNLRKFPSITFQLLPTDGFIQLSGLLVWF